MMGDKLHWKTDSGITIADYLIPSSLPPAHNISIRKDTSIKSYVKKAAWPILNLRNSSLVDGFIEREIGKWISSLIKIDTVFLEVGCGDMSLRRYLPKSTYYNAFDISLSEFHIKRVSKERRRNNIAIASATDIPLDSNIVSLIVSTECFEHIPEIELAVKEIHRIAMPGGRLLCSIPNNYCYKYQKKGPHEDHINNWTFQGFRQFMSRHGFRFLKGHQKGFWIPLPGRTSYQLPFCSRKEYYNTNFFYMFEVLK